MGQRHTRTLELNRTMLFLHSYSPLFLNCLRILAEKSLCVRLIQYSYATTRFRAALDVQLVRSDALYVFARRLN